MLGSVVVIVEEAEVSVVDCECAGGYKTVHIAVNGQRMLRSLILRNLRRES